MAITGILSWENETALNAYPLSKEFGLNSFLVDANFVQFDNFVPVLQSITLLDQNLVISLLTDVGTIKLTVATSEFVGTSLTKRIFDSTGRCIGTLVFGANALSLFENENTLSLDINIPFLSFLAKSIPSNCGVYSVAGKFGALSLTGDKNLWFTSITGRNGIVFNAAALGAISALPYLKTLNGIAPINNNVYMQETDLLKIATAGTATVQFSLIGSDISDLMMQNNNIIVKNLTPQT